MDLSVFRDKIVSSIASWRSSDANRASEVGEQREEIARLLELTALNKRALSWIRALDKLEADKRDDVLRSFDALRNHVMEPHWNGQRTPDFFEDTPPVEPVSEDAPRKPTYEPDPDFDEVPMAHDPEIAAEDEAFEKHLAQVSGDAA